MTSPFARRGSFARRRSPSVRHDPAVVDDRKGHWQVVPHAEDYDRGRFGDVKGRVYRWVEERALRRAIRPLARTDRILDAACGTGRITSLLLRAGFQGAVAAEISLDEMFVCAR